MQDWTIVGFVVVSLLVVLGLLWMFRRRGRRAIERPVPPVSRGDAVVREEKDVPPSVEPELVPPQPAPVALDDRLSRTRGALSTALGRLFGRGGASQFSSAEWEEAEEGLLSADVGLTTSQSIVGAARESAARSNGTGLKELLRAECVRIFDAVPVASPVAAKPLVISIVGINGVGKTTTIGKLASRFVSEGKSVLLGAGDTFRAGAISQLKVWADRAGTQFVAGKEGGDPGAVAYDAVSAAKARGLDVVIIDTAGRLHTKVNLMDELKKVHKVMKKVIPEAPHETWLVLDGTLGQNSVRQAKEFRDALELTGVVITKLDGTAKGGAALSVAGELRLPIRFIGVGESVEDLIPFEPSRFVDAILS